VYRIFADFTPAATGRSLYANADLRVERANQPDGAATPSSRKRLSADGPVRDEGVAAPFQPGKSWVYQSDGYRYTLRPSVEPIRTGQSIDLTFSIGSMGIAPIVPLEPVMGAFAHLVAFDAARSGFAHLHPAETDLAQPPDKASPVLNFKIMFPRPGTYVIWAQVKIAGRERFVPFWFEVE
jgi:hypothetical protein